MPIINNRFKGRGGISAAIRKKILDCAQADAPMLTRSRENPAGRGYGLLEVAFIVPLTVAVIVLFKVF